MKKSLLIIFVFFGFGAMAQSQNETQISNAPEVKSTSNVSGEKIDISKPIIPVFENKNDSLIYQKLTSGTLMPTKEFNARFNINEEK